MSQVDRARFEAETDAGPSIGQVEGLARIIRGGGAEASRAGRSLAAAFAHVAFLAPERIAQVYDEAAFGWYGQPVGAPPIPPPVEPTEPLVLTPAFWDAFWALVEDSGSGIGAAAVTTRTAALGALLPEAYSRRIALACAAYPQVRQAAADGPPGRFRKEDLAACPAESLGGAFHRLIVDNDFDLEVLDRDSLNLSRLPAPLGYLNARILQVHDLWHLVAGYRTTGLHEVGISAFQMAQFGHGYSAMFLAMVTASTSLKGGAHGLLLLETILGAWVHGRRTPSLIGVPWEDIWARPIEDVRSSLGVTAYASPFPADLFERAAAA